MHRALIPIVFLALMGWFLFGSADAEVPIPERDVVTKDMVEPTTLRQPISGEATIEVAGSAKRCQECHSIFESNPRPTDSLVQHTHILLDHGENDACLNCHDNDDRGRLALRDGETVGFADSARLCAQCHGTTYRDWQLGAHGRTNGFWDREAGEVQRHICAACHDPHAPAFPQLEPFPGPNTLRFVEPEHEFDAHLEGALGRFRHVIQEAREHEAAERAAEAEAARQRSEAKKKALEEDR